MKLIYTLILLIVISSCSTHKEAEDKVYYIINHPGKSNADSSDTAPPRPNSLFYGFHNFILFDNSRVFYHDDHSFYTIGEEIDRSKPPRIFLAPDSLKEIEIDKLLVFLQTHISDSIINTRKISAFISSSSDTLKNKAYEIITAYYKSKNIKCIEIRNWTEEEEFCLKAKLNNTAYDPLFASFKKGFNIKYPNHEDLIED